MNLILKLIFTLSWGYMKINNTHFYVTSGVCTYGPPIKLGSDNEIIVLDLEFSN